MTSGFEIVGLALAFLVGSVPFGPLLVGLKGGPRLRDVGSGNIGATNVARTSGLGVGVATLLLDAAKGWVGLLAGAAVVARAGGEPSSLFQALSVLAPVLGHSFSPFVGFRGGKGVATAIGVALAVDPWLTLAALGVFLAVAIPTRYVSAGSLALAVALAALSWWRPGAGPLAAGLTAVGALIVLRHRENIVRLVDGSENKFGSGSRGGSASGR